MVDDAERNHPRIHPPAEACRKLVDIANAHGGDDNITAVIVSFKSGQASQMRQLLNYKGILGFFV